MRTCTCCMCNCFAATWSCRRPRVIYLHLLRKICLSSRLYALSWFLQRWHGQSISAQKPLLTPPWAVSAPIQQLVTPMECKVCACRVPQGAAEAHLILQICVPETTIFRSVFNCLHYPRDVIMLLWAVLLQCSVLYYSWQRHMHANISLQVAGWGPWFRKLLWRTWWPSVLCKRGRRKDYQIRGYCPCARLGEQKDSVFPNGVHRFSYYCVLSVIPTPYPFLDGYRQDCSGMVSMAWQSSQPGHVTYNMQVGMFDLR